MGERANIVIAQHPDGDAVGHLFLYTHWGGYELPAVLQRALAKRWRWDDEQYLARIVFCEMIRGREQGETGFGLSTFIHDNGYPILLVDTETQTVRVTDPGLKDGPEYAFEAYLLIDMGKNPWAALGQHL